MMTVASVRHCLRRPRRLRICTDHSSTSESQESKEANCWNTPRPTAIDIQATEIFIDIVKDCSIQILLKDKNTTKNKVWIKVFNEMVKRGYCIHSV